MPTVDFQFNLTDQTVARIQQRNGFTDPIIHARKDSHQVDFEFSSSRQTVANIQESTGFKPITPNGVMTDYEEKIRIDQPLFRNIRSDLPDLTNKLFKDKYPWEK